MTQNEWSERFTRQVAETIRRHRLERGLSTQKLSDACAEIGHPIPRSVLANLEAGRRPMIAVTEVLVLAQALGVPPAWLLMPLGVAGAVDALPGERVATPRGMRWIVGAVDLDGWDLRPDLASLRDDMGEHEQIALIIERDCMPNVEEYPADLEPYFELAEYHRDLMRLRRRMEANGWAVPELQPALDWVETVRATEAEGQLDSERQLPRNLRPGARLPWRTS